MSDATAELEQSLARALKTKDKVEAAQKKIDPVFKRPFDKGSGRHQER